MTEQQIDQEILTGFGRLDTALAPPMDALERIEHRMVARRRRRRTTAAGVTALGLVVAGGAVVALVSGDGTGETIATDQPSGPHSTLVLTRPDGSTYAFPDVEVTCAAPEGDEAQADGPQRIWALSPRHVQDGRAVEPFVYFNGIVSEIEGDQTFTFPNDWAMGSSHLPMVLFMADTDGNEVASSAGGESGTVRVLEASCSPVPVLRLRVDMDLGSETGKDTLHVAGDLG